MKEDEGRKRWTKGGEVGRRYNLKDGIGGRGNDGKQRYRGGVESGE